LTKLIHVQILRALAALSVAFLHAQHDAQTLAERAGTVFARLDTLPWMAGVDVFFVISGFIMVYTSRTLFGRQGAWRVFMARRIARIVPLYWAATTAYLVAMWVVPGFLNSDRQGWWPIAASYLFIPYTPIEGPVQPVFSLGWTLNYEMLFYILFASVLLWRRQAALRLMLTVLVVLVIVGSVNDLSQPFSFWTRPIILEFGFGAALGWLRLRGVVLPTVLRYLLAVAGLVLLWANGIGLYLTEDGMRPLAWGIPAAMMVAAAVFEPDEPRPRSLTTRLAAAVGDVSYALYLVHPFVIRPIGLLFARWDVAGPAGLWLFIAVSLTAALLASAAVHLAFERPVTTWLRRRLEND
jgi:peptidoglycan/LPS O-acetylase OafA/YrhL